MKHRLFRGGHRQANAAIYRIVACAGTTTLDRATTAQGLTKKDHPLSEALRRPRDLQRSPPPPLPDALLTHRGFNVAESVIGVYKTEVIQQAVEFATLTWVDWFNTRRLLGPLGDIPPAEFEAQYYEQAEVA